MFSQNFINLNTPIEADTFEKNMHFQYHNVSPKKLTNPKIIIEFLLACLVPDEDGVKATVEIGRAHV